MVTGKLVEFDEAAEAPTEEFSKDMYPYSTGSRLTAVETATNVEFGSQSERRPTLKLLPTDASASPWGGHPAFLWRVPRGTPWPQVIASISCASKGYQRNFSHFFPEFVLLGTFSGRMPARIRKDLKIEPTTFR